jgi:hypothetical protein
MLPFYKYWNKLIREAIQTNSEAFLEFSLDSYWHKLDIKKMVQRVTFTTMLL